MILYKDIVFLSIFLILGDFYLKSYSYIWELSRDDCGMVQNIFEYHFGLGYGLKNQIWTPKLNLGKIISFEIEASNRPLISPVLSHLLALL